MSLLPTLLTTSFLLLSLLDPVLAPAGKNPIEKEIEKRKDAIKKSNAHAWNVLAFAADVVLISLLPKRFQGIERQQIQFDATDHVMGPNKYSFLANTNKSDTKLLKYIDWLKTRNRELQRTSVNGVITGDGFLAEIRKIAKEYSKEYRVPNEDYLHQLNYGARLAVDSMAVQLERFIFAEDGEFHSEDIEIVGEQNANEKKLLFWYLCYYHNVENYLREYSITKENVNKLLDRGQSAFEKSHQKVLRGTIEALPGDLAEIVVQRKIGKGVEAAREQKKLLVLLPQWLEMQQTHLKGRIVGGGNQQQQQRSKKKKVEEVLKKDPNCNYEFMADGIILF